MPEIVSADTPGPLPPGFLDVPLAVYGDDPNWPPEDPATTSSAFSSANPWFESGRARTWCVGGEARAACFVGPTTVVDGVPAAFFGYWQTTGAPGRDAALFAAVEAWAGGQGAATLYGPIDFSTYGNYRVLEADDGAAPVVPFPGEPYNRPYYSSVLEGLGFEACMRYDSRFFGRSAYLAYLERRRAARDQLVAEGYRFEPLRVADWMANLRELHSLADLVFAQNFAYTPLPFELFEMACGEAFVRKACPVTSQLAFGPEGDIAGIKLTYPHWGALTRQGAGDDRVTPTALDYAQHFPLLATRGPVTMLHKTCGIPTKHQGRGLYHAFMANSIERGESLGVPVEFWVAATAREDNLSQTAYDAHPAKRNRYTLFAKMLR